MATSAPSDRRDAKHGSLESSRGDESIGGGIAPLRLVIVEISDKTRFGAVKGIEKTKCSFFLMEEKIFMLKDFMAKFLKIFFKVGLKRIFLLG
jgi:hypothetical protein